MAELWEGHQRFTFQASLLPEYNEATDPCQGEVLHQWPWRVYHHGEFLSWPGDNYQAPSHSHPECQVADRLVRAVDHYSRFWENCKICIINLFLNYGNGCRSISGRPSLHFLGGEKRPPEIRLHSQAISVGNSCWDHGFNKMPFMMRTFMWSEDQNNLPLKVCNGSK